MKISVQTIHSEVKQDILEHAVEKLEKIGSKYHWIPEATVFFKEEKNDHDRNKVIEILLKVPGPDLFVKEQENSYQLALKKAFQSVRRQISKYETRHFSHTAAKPLK